MNRRRGFTMVELLMVLIILGLLAAIALLKYIDLRNSARAAALAGDFRSVQVAAFNYYADHESWPAETGTGVVPAELTSYLPGPLAGSFDRGVYQLDYENVMIGGSTPLIGVSVVSADARLMAKFIQTFSTDTPFFLYGGKLTYIISGPGGIF